MAIHRRQAIGRAAVEAVRSARGLTVPETQEQLDWLQADLADSLAMVQQ